MNDKILRGQFTNCHNGEIKNKEIIYKVEKDLDKGYSILYLINGVTGYESVPLNDVNRVLHLSSSGWLACAGTKHKYDKLVITSYELIKVFVKEKIIIVNLD